MASKKNFMPISGDLLPQSNKLPSSLNVPMPSPSLNIIQQLNPLEHISNAIKTICYYKEQCKLIDLEMRRIEKGAEITMREIDKSFLIEMDKLKIKRVDAERKLGIAANQLKSQSVNREKLMESMTDLVKQICDPNLDIEHKKIINEAMQSIRDTLKSTNDSSYSILELLIINVKQDLDNIKLLGGD